MVYWSIHFVNYKFSVRSLSCALPSVMDKVSPATIFFMKYILCWKHRKFIATQSLYLYSISEPIMPQHITSHYIFLQLKLWGSNQQPQSLDSVKAVLSGYEVAPTPPTMLEFLFDDQADHSRHDCTKAFLAVSAGQQYTSLGIYTKLCTGVYMYCFFLGNSLHRAMGRGSVIKVLNCYDSLLNMWQANAHNLLQITPARGRRDKLHKSRLTEM